jgi:hypothetical protein
MRHARSRAALDRRDVDMTIVRGEKDQSALGVQNVVVVDRRQVIDGHDRQLDLAVQIEPPQQAVSVEQEATTVGSPVRCFQQQSIRGVHQLSRSVRDLGDPHLRPLTRSQLSRQHQLAPLSYASSHVMIKIAGTESRVVTKIVSRAKITPRS